MTDIEQRAREMLIDACCYCGVEVPPGYLLAPFDADSGPWMVAQRLAKLAALHPSAGEAEAERRGMLRAADICEARDTGRIETVMCVHLAAAIRAAAQPSKDEQ